jgi:hypothetical protein
MPPLAMAATHCGRIICNMVSQLNFSDIIACLVVLLRIDQVS